MALDESQNTAPETNNLANGTNQKAKSVEKQVSAPSRPKIDRSLIGIIYPSAD